MRLFLQVIFVLSTLLTSAQLPPCAVIRVGGSHFSGDSIRGPWEMQGSDSFFEIIASPGSGEYLLSIIDSPEAEVEKDAVKGTLRPLVDPRKFDLELEEQSHSAKRTHTFIATFAPDYSTMTFHQYQRHRSLSIDRLFPYLFRIGFSKSNPRPNDIDGAVNLNLPRRQGEIVL